MKLIIKAISLFALSALFALNSYSQRLSYTLTDRWLDGDWQPFIKSELTFNAANQPDSITSYLFDVQQGKYVVGSLLIFTYNSDSTQQSELNKNWDTTTNTWNNSLRIQYTYNAQGKRLLSTIDTWREGQWQPAQRITNTYNSSNFLTQTLTETYSTANSAFQFSEQLVYTPDSFGNTEKMVRLTWNTNTQSWASYQQELYTYNSSNLLIATVNQNWEQNAWVNSSKQEVTYTNSNQVSNYLFLYWNKDNSNYDTSARYSSTYNVNDKLLQRLTQVYNQSTGQWLNNERMVCVYESPTGLIEQEKLTINAYPSPCQNELHVTLPEVGDASLKVMDALGRILLTQEVKQQTTLLDVSLLQANTYFLVIQQNGKSGVKAFIKQ